MIYQGRTDGMNQWKSAHAVKTEARTLAEAMEGADVFFGLSAKGACHQDMVRSMAPKPIIFALANPDPEITPEDVRAVRSDAIIATGRSDYPNQVNNVLGFPYIFRGALDVRASTINDEMKIAAARALAALAREDVPDEVAAAYQGRRLRYRPGLHHPGAVRPAPDRRPSRRRSRRPRWKAASRASRSSTSPPTAMRFRARLDPIAGTPAAHLREGQGQPKRVVFAEGEEDRSIRAALAFAQPGYGTPILIGREEIIREQLTAPGSSPTGTGSKSTMPGLSDANHSYTDYLYGRLQRRGMLQRDCQRMVNQDRNVFAALMVAQGDADAMVTGLTRNFATCSRTSPRSSTRAIQPARFRRLGRACRGSRPSSSPTRR